MQQQNNNQQQRPQRPKRRFDLLMFLFVILTIVGVFSFIRTLSQPQAENLTFAQLEMRLESNEIQKMTVSPVGGENYGVYEASGKLTDGKSFTVILLDNELAEIRGNSAYKADIIIEPISENIWLSLLFTFLPYLIFGIPMIYFIVKMMKSQGGAGGAFDFAKSTAKLSRSKSVTFKDVAGCDEEKEELVEIIDFLKNPRKYNEIGARVPKGVMLYGPPGTGKTLLAKAVAGEAGVPFFSISGSDFVEMFVGVGASRVRDMFKTAKENAPCIIFIDEIDAVGRQRGAGMGGGHDEREQTLNQLLVEMDGFAGNTGIIIMAATNRPDVLDPALLRPGRFDRQITIGNPNVIGREEILKVHARNKHLAPEVKLSEIAQRTPGFSGADIENLLNEAALLAARDNRKVIETADIDEAIDRVMMGPAKKSKKYTEKEKRLVAYHEAGHAVIGLKLENASVVQKVTIVPRGQAGGYNLMMPKEETYFHTKGDLLDSITGFLGGRVAEEIKFNEVSTGASNDFQNATRIARSMVTEYGMSDLGPVQYEQPQGSVFLGRDYLKDKNFSDQVALEIDRETRRIVEECYDVARKVINENIDLLDKISYYLMKIETLTKSDIDEIAATGTLSWYEEKLKRDQEAAERKSLVLEEEKPNEDSTVVVEENVETIEIVEEEAEASEAQESTDSNDQEEKKD